MIVTSDYVDIRSSGAMRSLVVRPTEPGTFPGILFYSDIFQLTGAMHRACARLAGYGFVVLAPEIYHRLEPAGSAFPFDDAGRERGLRDAAETAVAEFDADCRAALDVLVGHPCVTRGAMGAAGFCIGGHLAFRAALQPDVKATVCFYGTGIHNGRLGKDVDARSLQRVGEIRGQMLLVWGTKDPHIPEDGRVKVAEALGAAGVRYQQRFYAAEHAFMRDEGPRYDPEATDAAFGEAIAFFRTTL